MGYTDLTSEFDYKDLLTYQNMDKLGENDAYTLIPSGTIMPFFQSAAPTGWAKQVSFNDGALRVTSGVGGGTGGTEAISAATSFAHTHTGGAHVHTTAHSHEMAYTIIGTGGPSSDFFVGGADTDGADLFVAQNPSATSQRKFLNQTLADGEGESGSASLLSDSQLSTITFAYADVIVCQKV